MLETLVLADDLTGALEAGACFSDCLVTTDSSLATIRTSLVIDTETRHLSPVAAASAIERCLRPAKLIYKKTDSTLRGNIGFELAVLARTFPERPILYVGAYPALGRTVKNGELHVNGVRVHETAFARDPLNPVTSSSIRELLSGIHCTIHDGETDADIALIAEQILAMRIPVIVAGPAAIGRALGGRPPAPWPRFKTCTIASGSLHPTSIRQIETARGRLPAAWRIVHHDILSSVTMDNMIVFGGDTAFGITRALGVSCFEPIGEIMKGVPVSRMLGTQHHIVTKAGGFGDDDILLRLAELLYD
jgi:D-threonate/D-erythronate kinase